MRVALVCPDDHSFWLFRQGLIKRLVDRGHSVDLYCHTGPYCDALEQLGARLIHIPFKRHIAPLSDLKVTWMMTRYFSRRRPDIVHCFTAKPNIFGTCAAWLAGVKLRVGSVTGLGAIYLDPHEKSPGSVTRNFVMLTLYRIASRAMHKIWFQNPDDLQYALDKGFAFKDKALLLRSSGIDFTIWADDLKNDNLRREARAELKASQDEVLVTAVSRAQSQKGVTEFIEASRIIPKMLSAIQPMLKIRFLLVGGVEAGSPPELSAEALERESRRTDFHWLGHQHHVQKYLAATDILVHASYYREGVPRVLLEGMAMKLPIISTDSPGCREALRPGLNGLKVPVRDSTALAKAIVLLARSSRLRRSFGEAGHRFAEEFYQEFHIVDGVIRQLYQLPEDSDSQQQPSKVINLSH